MRCFGNFVVTESPHWPHFRYLELTLSDVTNYPTWINAYQIPVQIGTPDQTLPNEDDDPETFPFFIYQTRRRFHEILRAYLDDKELRLLITAEIKNIEQRSKNPTNKVYEITIIFSSALNKWEMVFYFNKKYVLIDLIRYPVCSEKSMIGNTASSPKPILEPHPTSQNLGGIRAATPIARSFLPLSPSPCATPTSGSPIPISLFPPAAPNPTPLQFGNRKSAFAKIIRN